ncbi:hypothetical protein GW944_01040 [Candidatus Parcubacteria bacterium]|nr:hypothetical protein [Candidatus Parcubacteria bacterium]
MHRLRVDDSHPTVFPPGEWIRVRFRTPVEPENLVLSLMGKYDSLPLHPSRLVVLDTESVLSHEDASTSHRDNLPQTLVLHEHLLSKKEITP